MHKVHPFSGARWFYSGSRADGLHVKLLQLLHKNATQYATYWNSNPAYRPALQPYQPGCGEDFMAVLICDTTNRVLHERKKQMWQRVINNDTMYMRSALCAESRLADG